mmetsp:Transcript_27377/g.40103  ORF Transcript_27377/g.40103 Transcript_27377/m.40103 type:complete len:311 (-) Transcript_27377:401-1333(-)
MLDATKHVAPRNRRLAKTCCDRALNCCRKAGPKSENTDSLKSAMNSSSSVVARRIVDISLSMRTVPGEGCRSSRCMSLYLGTCAARIISRRFSCASFCCSISPSMADRKEGDTVVVVLPPAERLFFSSFLRFFCSPFVLFAAAARSRPLKILAALLPSASLALDAAPTRAEPTEVLRCCALVLRFPEDLPNSAAAARRRRDSAAAATDASTPSRHSSSSAISSVSTTVASTSIAASSSELLLLVRLSSRSSLSSITATVVPSDRSYASSNSCATCFNSSAVVCSCFRSFVVAASLLLLAASVVVAEQITA